MARERRTTVALAKVLRTSQQSASRRVNGDTPLTLDELALAAAWLGMPITDFFKDAV